MEKIQETFEQLSSFAALYDASYKVCRSVRWKDSTISFEENRLDIIFALQEALQENQYQQRLFNCFTVVERGKARDIRACHINDRLVQNALCEQVLIPVLTNRFIYDNSATLKDRGMDFALKRAKKHLVEAQREYGLDKTFYGLRLDIRKYFDSIDHQSLKDMINRYVVDSQTQNLVHYIIDTFAYDVTQDEKPLPDKQYYIVSNEEYKLYRGKKFNPHYKYYEFRPKSLGLGSQTSQLLALLALNDVDHYSKEHLHLHYYGRYMDDIYVLHHDKEYLSYCKVKIEAKLKEAGLTLNQKKTSIVAITPQPKSTSNYVGKKQPRKEPFKFLKWNFYLTDTGKIIQLPFKEKVKKQRIKLRKMAKLWESGEITTTEVLDSYRGWRAHISKGTTFYLIQDMDNLFRSLFKGVEIK